MASRSGRDGRSAIVLCGGRSGRFGTDKALAVWEGRTLLERVIDVCRSVAAEVILAVGPESRYEEVGLPIVLDGSPDGGPLAGIAAGLERSTREYFLAVAVDLPFITAPAVEILFERLPGCDFVIPRTAGGLEPLFSAGRTAVCLDAARRVLASEVPAPKQLAEILVTREIDVAGEGNALLTRALRNVNTRGDLESFRASDRENPRPRN